MEACPVMTDSGRYVQCIADGDYLEAFLVARSSNPLASICGRICAAPCEDACRRNWIDGAVMIRPLKRFVTEQFGVESSSPETFRELLRGKEDPGCSRPAHLSQLAGRQEEGKGKKVAVVGSGPAGLGCAHDLALLGYDVTVFEALDQPGGMLRYGIPEYRLPRGVIDREVAAIEKLGAEFRYRTPLTPELDLQALRKEGFEAFFLSVGASRGRDLEVEGHDQDGVIKAVDYLLNLNQGYRVDLGERVVVIGGGSVAMDAARTAVRKFYEPMDEIEATAEAAASQPALDAARGALRGGATEQHRPYRDATSSTKRWRRGSSFIPPGVPRDSSVRVGSKGSSWSPVPASSTPTVASDRCSMRTRRCGWRPIPWFSPSASSPISPSSGRRTASSSPAAAL
jgi:NADPH-dependent glutamate synthase beta subunit-like oxidoreductase